jgi:hypothetical protein
MRRYEGCPVINNGQNYGTSFSVVSIRNNIKNNNIRILNRIVLQQNQRLDTVAGDVYGNGKLWWIIAAASNIGWGLQCPAGTILLIPDLSDVAKYL